MSLRNNRVLAVTVGAAVLVAASTFGAVAAKLVTSADIKDQTIKKIDIKKGGVGGSEVKDESLKVKDLSDDARAKLKGNTGPTGARGPAGPAGPAGAAATFAGKDWSIIDRNVLAGGDAYLRAGPSAGTTVAPPLGIGSLGIRDGGAPDKAAFGNQVAFVGNPLSGVNAVGFSVFTTGENRAQNLENLPNITVEIDPTGSANTTAPNFSSLVFNPADATANAWTTIDASTAQRWSLTGAAGTTANCTLATLCTLDQVKAAWPNASILSVGIGKGTDAFQFSGAVDALRWNATTYDFEPFGVTATP
jgi:hypothetical protein